MPVDRPVFQLGSLRLKMIKIYRVTSAKSAVGHCFPSLKKGSSPLLLPWHPYHTALIRAVEPFKRLTITDVWVIFWTHILVFQHIGFSQAKPPQ
jgi:hypothetical protein